MRFFPITRANGRVSEAAGRNELTSCLNKEKIYRQYNPGPKGEDIEAGSTLEARSSASWLTMNSKTTAESKGYFRNDAFERPLNLNRLCSRVRSESDTVTLQD